MYTILLFCFYDVLGIMACHIQILFYKYRLLSFYILMILLYIENILLNILIFYGATNVRCK